MAAVATTVGILLTLFECFIHGNKLKSTVVFSPEELMNDSHFLNTSLKPALRYGFQRTSECKDFSKAYICVQKCLDLGFDVAYSNRHCFCTCYHKRGKVKSTPQVTKLVTKTKWRLGAPTTKLPAWASTREKDVKLKHNETQDVQYVLIDGNLSDVTFTTQSEDSTHTLETGTPVTGDIGNSTDVTGLVNTTVVADNATQADNVTNADNATGAKENGTAQTGGTGTPKDAEHVNGTGVTDAGNANSTATGNANANVTIPDSSNAGNGTNLPTSAPSNNTGGTEASNPTTKPNDTTGGTDKPKADTGAPTTAHT